MTTDRTDDTQARDKEAQVEVIPPLPAAKLPIVQPTFKGSRSQLRLKRGLSILVLLIVALGVGFWWLQSGPSVPPGFAWGNGRLEADEIDIDTKFTGRIAKMLVDQGDLVKAGQVVAIMDTQDLQTQQRKAEAVVLQSERAIDEAQRNLSQQESQVLSSQAAVQQAQRAIDEANANLQQQQTVTKLAKQELDRTSALVPKGFATVELLDQRRQIMNGAIAAQSAAEAKVSESEHAFAAAKHNEDAAVAARDAAAARVDELRSALDAAKQDVEYYKVNIADNSLVAPRDGPIEYRVATIGEVLPSGGKVFTMLDASYVYMDIYLPTPEAGRVRIGSDARIVLDAYPNHIIPAKVIFVAREAQFTPKTVETKSERDKLMFRIRVQVDPERLKGREELVRSGLPGGAYVRTDPAATWPSNLQPSAPPTPTVPVTP